MEITVFLLLFAGLALLVAGAESLVRGASRLALALGISPLIIGLTIVAFGTSAPEMSVSVMSGLNGQGALALGNVIGSNIFNVLFILGLSALIAPLVVAQQLIRLDVPLLIGASIAVWLLAADGRLGRLDGFLLFAGIIGYTAFLIRQSRRESSAVTAEYAAEFGEPPSEARRTWLIDIARIALGLGGLVLGSRWLVSSAVEIATWLGVSELVIGLTIVAIGTSLPEVATSVVASLRGERDIAVGNVIGSNLFNLLAVLGLVGLVSPAGVPVASHLIQFDLIIMIGVAIACLPIFFTGHLIARWEGGLFLGYYVAYMAYVLLGAQSGGRVGMLQDGLLYFALPLTAVTLLILTWRAWRNGGEVASAPPRNS
jgi:cation:H+ antiporter